MNNRTLSVILLSYYSEERIVRSYERLAKILDEEKIPFEFIVMDDCSSDNSYEIALDLQRRHSRVKAYQLSRNCTSHYSIFAGLSVAIGGCVAPIPDDEQQPYETIVKMYRLWESGEKVIIPFREARDDSWITQNMSKIFYSIMSKYSVVKFPSGGVDTFFIDREIVDILNKYIHPINTTTITEVLRLGFSPYYLPYQRNIGLNKGKSRWSMKKKIKLAKDFFFSCSSFPIELITRIGLFFSVISFILMFGYIYINLFGNNQFWGINVPGWTSLIVAISFFSGLILLSLGVISEYIWRIYEEVKARPGYIIKQKRGDEV